MRVLAVNPTPFVSPIDGAVWSVAQLDVAPGQLHLPYCRENATLVGRLFDGLPAPRPLFISAIQSCPVCGAQLHLSAARSLCCNLSCPSRRGLVLQTQLLTLGLAGDPWYLTRLSYDPDFQLVDTLALPGARADALRAALRRLDLAGYLSLYSFPAAVHDGLLELFGPHTPPALVHALAIQGMTTTGATDAILGPLLSAVREHNPDFVGNLAVILGSP